MVSASMALQEYSGSTDSETTLPLGNQATLDVDVSSIKGIYVKGQFQSGDDHAMKVRKPYTITKQRERWSEEEHKKFLEALKLYGRAWRRIEEHVGTKTAVQIRSHAQKFFTKVVRESNNGDAVSVKTIEIPPPRPKRKPLHPYPRKLSTPTKATALVLEKPARSIAPDACLPTEDNQSPTSVLSAFCSDPRGATDSNMPEDSLSPVSSVVSGSAGLDLSETPNLLPAEGITSSSSSQVNNSSNQDEKPPLKLELFPEENSFAKEGSVEVSSAQCLKLFGKTVMVTDSCMPSSPIPVECKMQASNQNEGTLEKSVQWNFIPIKYSQGDLGCSWGAQPSGANATLYCLPLRSEISNTGEQSRSHPLPCRSDKKVAAIPVVQVHSPIPIKASLLSDSEEMQESEIPKDGSSSNSSTESQCMNGDSNLEAESYQLFLGKEKNALLSCRTCREASFFAQRTSSCNRTKGFLPYKKRCLSDRDVRSVVTGEERDELRIRLCL